MAAQPERRASPVPRSPPRQGAARRAESRAFGVRVPPAVFIALLRASRRCDGTESSEGSDADALRRRNRSRLASDTGMIASATTMQMSHWCKVQLDGAEDAVEDPELCAEQDRRQRAPVHIGTSGPPTLEREHRTRSSRVVREKRTLLIANVVRPIVRATALRRRRRPKRSGRERHRRARARRSPPRAGAPRQHRLVGGPRLSLHSPSAGRP